MGPMSLFLGGPAFAVVVLIARALAGRLGLPEATLLVLLAALMGFIPGIPQVHLPPDVAVSSPGSSSPGCVGGSAIRAARSSCPR
jgi:hypothetical protein